MNQKSCVLNFKHILTDNFQVNLYVFTGMFKNYFFLWAGFGGCDGSPSVQVHVQFHLHFDSKGIFA